jgi:hypothetical protein
MITAKDIEIDCALMTNVCLDFTFIAYRPIRIKDSHAFRRIFWIQKSALNGGGFSNDLARVRVLTQNTENLIGSLNVLTSFWVMATDVEHWNDYLQYRTRV